MIPGGADPFGAALQADPAVALPVLDVAPPTKAGPLHKVQFVVEFVGPRSIPAPAATHLLASEWYQALGQPQLFAMRPADLQWQQLTNSIDGSYDSLALAWDMVTPRGSISKSAATHLLQTAERFAPFIQRRVIPLPDPKEIDRVVKSLIEIRDALDIGFALSIYAPPGGYRERDLWVMCARLGLKFGSHGSFDWQLPGFAHPLLSVTPFGDTDAFALSGVNAGATHLGVTIGFSLPLSPSPSQALQGCFHVAQIISRDMGGDVRDQDDRKLTEKIRQELRENLRLAIGAFSNAGMTTGAPEAVKLFAE
ncbi:cell division protein ZipA C-terminal FtsZ-binding domain-containing protein [Fimbriimonas ginsengisoli]|uniref:Cell division protein ZipA n=1 Tax=Fimbriimonas ginsengisoli Gsoil 348 TaxID=661478 RepID=A0A068NUA1_FIMGI|nr:cell division protein ZipA C-terminal FtsZ-binding domain-containing protein [Fimbriimonas ginsengisoli]AIE87078.1 hypothetical protein OP10G_3710 [Fimbriimonas ginsengisoli Gsoil 348]